MEEEEWGDTREVDMLGGNRGRNTME